MEEIIVVDARMGRGKSTAAVSSSQVLVQPITLFLRVYTILR
jgi:hypothetical protein